ncbi:hypothetical protein Tco_1340359 [Tanacetum coccineum]
MKEMQYFEQPPFINDSDIDITNDSNVILYEQYLKETETEVKKENKIVNESLTVELERYKEQINFFEERQKVDLNDREKYIDSQMRGVIVDRNAKFPDFQNQIHTLKQQLSATVKSHKTLSTTVDVLKKESKAKEDKHLKEITDLEKKKKALDIVKDHAKLNDPIAKDKKVNIVPIDYAALNKLSKHFVKYFVPQKQLYVEQALWLPISKPVSEIPPVQPEPVLKEIPRELPTIKRKFSKIKEKKFLLENDRLLELIISQDLVHTAVKQSYVDEYNECLELKLKGKDMTISNLKMHIANLKGKAGADCSETINCSRVNALGMYKLDLEPLSPKLRKNREARKSKKHTHKPKAEDSIQEKMYLLHMDLCDPMRIESINGK